MSIAYQFHKLLKSNARNYEYLLLSNIRNLFYLKDILTFYSESVHHILIIWPIKYNIIIGNINTTKNFEEPRYYSNVVAILFFNSKLYF